jgi:hypothetical protein
MFSKPIDWSQLWYPGPKRVFTAPEMAAAGGDGPSPTLLTMLAVNLALTAAVFLQLPPANERAQLLVLMLPLTVAALAAGHWLWWRPWRKPLMLITLGCLLVTVLLVTGLRWRLPNHQDRAWMVVLLATWGAVTPVLLWFLVVWRAHQIEARLSEQAEREKAVEMARRLAAAQMEPHFLFNTLASLQHWVDTKDDRASSLLTALTGYLRATLPMFKRPTLALHEELLAVERYLLVMQARMGKRLAWQIDAAPELRDLALPPGVLLTLVENAILHGLEPQLAGGEVRLSAQVRGHQAHVDVVDNGRGLDAQAADGVGLSNIRQRLALAFGDSAKLELRAAPQQGVWAHLEIPWTKART